ncbi:membrane protein insertase YidC [Dactylosporangium sp. NPDC048998]|uniref:membrane protein insertase YidC n=1 Tax=Dactylosporangium sp. NPDC048998 TaxID=3363976 RepID=UPI003717E321
MVHHVLIVLAGVLGSVPAAIVVATLLLRALLLPLSLRAYRAERVRARLAPRIAELRERHSHEPVVLAEKTAALMRGEGSGPFAGLLPSLAQAPFVWLLYREFTGTAMHGHTLLGAELTARLVGHPALVAGWLVVAALAGIALWNVRQLPEGSPRFVRALSFGTVLFAPFVPLAAGLYLVTTGVWTAAERWVLRRAPAGEPGRQTDGAGRKADGPGPNAGGPRRKDGGSGRSVAEPGRKGEENGRGVAAPGRKGEESGRGVAEPGRKGGGESGLSVAEPGRRKGGENRRKRGGSGGNAAALGRGGGDRGRGSRRR